MASVPSHVHLMQCRRSTLATLLWQGSPTLWSASPHILRFQSHVREVATFSGTRLGVRPIVCSGNKMSMMNENWGGAGNSESGMSRRTALLGVLTGAVMVALADPLVFAEAARAVGIQPLNEYRLYGPKYVNYLNVSPPPIPVEQTYASQHPAPLWQKGWEGSWKWHQDHAGGPASDVGGVDLHANEPGVPVQAPTSGTVHYGSFPVYWTVDGVTYHEPLYWIRLDHDLNSGWSDMFYHVQPRYPVDEGSWVASGTEIGTSGNSGHVGWHLHRHLLKNKVRYNPIYYFSDGNALVTTISWDDVEDKQAFAEGVAERLMHDPGFMGFMTPSITGGKASNDIPITGSYASLKIDSATTPNSDPYIANGAVAAATISATIKLTGLPSGQYVYFQWVEYSGSTVASVWGTTGARGNDQPQYVTLSTAAEVGAGHSLRLQARTTAPNLSGTSSTGVVITEYSWRAAEWNLPTS